MRALKARVGASSLKKGENPNADHRVFYNTTSGSIHKEFDNIEKIDKEMQVQQRKKLTKSNFSVGGSPLVYDTTNKLQFYPMRA